MKKILLCELNMSEGTDAVAIEKVTAALRGTPGVTVMDVDSDKDHNRTVYTWIGEPENVLAGAQNLTEKALEIIDMSRHQGSHPRMGAVDVVPFVPVRGVEKEEALEIANSTPFGLGGIVFSADEERAFQVAEMVDSGSVGVNLFASNHAAPFGGRHDSGLGVEYGVEGLQQYVSYKSIHRASRA